MAASKDVITRIQDLVGEDVTTVDGYKDLICSGFNYVADMIPNDSELWRHSELDDSSSLEDSSEYKVIIVTRYDSADSVKRVAKEVPLDYLRRGEDQTSIYYNAGNYKNPIFSFTPDGTFVGRPTGGTFNIYRFKYLTGADEDVDITTVKDFADIRFPEEASFMAILKSASNILHALISNAIQEEEDQELLSLLNSQLQSVSTAIQDEMNRLNIPNKLVGDGNDVK